MLRNKVITSFVLLAMTFPAFAQAPRGFARPKVASGSTGSTATQAQANAVTAIATLLNLSSAQVSSLNTLLAARNTQLQQVQQTKMANEKTVQTLMAEQTPDPTALGNAMLAVRDAGSQAKQVETTFQTGFNGLLQPQQQQLYAALQNAANNLGPFRTLGLIGSTSGSTGASPNARRGGMAGRRGMRGFPPPHGAF